MRLLTKVITAIVLTPLILLIAGIAGCEAIKGYYDWQVRRMCEKDGGITIYEQIAISPQAAATMRRVAGHLSIANENAAAASDIAFLRSKRQYIRGGYLSIQRLEQAVIRRSDEKTVARMVRYSRAGGDFPLTVSNPTTFACPQGEQYYGEIAKIFVIEGEGK